MTGKSSSNLLFLPQIHFYFDLSIVTKPCSVEIGLVISVIYIRILPEEKVAPCENVRQITAKQINQTSSIKPVPLQLLTWFRTYSLIYLGASHKRCSPKVVICRPLDVPHVPLFWCSPFNGGSFYSYILQVRPMS